MIKAFIFLFLTFPLFMTNSIAEYGDFLDVIINYKDHEYCRAKGTDRVDHMPKGYLGGSNAHEINYWVRNDRYIDIYYDCRLNRELGYE